MSPQPPESANGDRANGSNTEADGTSSSGPGRSAQSGWQAAKSLRDAAAGRPAGTSGRGMRPNAPPQPGGQDRPKGRVEAAADKAAKAKAAVDTAQKATRAASGDVTAVGQLALSFWKRYGKRIIFGLVAMSALLFFALFSGGDNRIEYSGTVNDDLDRAQITAYSDVVHEHSDGEVPWTVVAGLSFAQTQHGRYSPYDSIDRAPHRDDGLFTPAELPGEAVDGDDEDAGEQESGGEEEGPSPEQLEDAAEDARDAAEAGLDGATRPSDQVSTVEQDDVSTFPVLVPPIGDPNEGQAQGPFLIRAEYAVSLDNPQDYVESMRFVTDHLVEIRGQLEDEGWELDESEPETHDQFWIEAINRLVAYLQDPQSASTDTACALPSGSPDLENHSAWVDQLWRCEASDLLSGGRDLQVVTGVSFNDEGDPSFQIRTGQQALSTLLVEARTVSRAFIDANGGFDDYSCDEDGGGHQGWFPVDGQLHTRTGALAERVELCDVEVNVRAAARTVLLANTQPVNTRDILNGPYRPMVAGWETLLWPAGNAATAGEFARTGPYSAAGLSDACETLVADGFDALATDQAAIDRLIAAADEAGEDQLALGAVAQTMLAEVGISAARTDPRCAMPSGAAPEGAQWADALADYADRYAPILLEGAGSGNGQATLNLQAAFSALTSGLRAIPGELQPFEAGRSAAISRLNGERRAVPDTPPYASNRNSSGFSSGPSAIAHAIWFGGLFVDDPRAGAEPQGGMSGGAMTMATGFALTIEDDPRNNSQAWLYPHPSKGDATFLECGNRGGHYARHHMAERWEAFCNDAHAAGVNVTVTDSTRSLAMQTDVHRRKPNLAARPGNSRHERGAAIDYGEGNQLRPWAHHVVGCYDTTGESYRDLTASGDDLNNRVYADRAAAGQPVPCTGSELPIKRIQTYGLIFPLCTLGGYALDHPIALRCDLGTGAGGPRENWHMQPGIPLSVSAMSASCGGSRSYDSSDPQSIAVLVYEIFYCEASAAGLDQRPPTPAKGPWDPSRYGFNNLAQQVAAEAVVVGYCESGYTETNMGSANHTNNYGGVFQMGKWEAETYVPGGKGNPSMRFQIEPNIIGAARYFLANEGKGHWKGWSPWAVVNTDLSQGRFAGHNNVNIPLVPRFTSTRHGHVGKQLDAGLPDWAVNPASRAPSGNCPTVYRQNGSW